MRLVVLDAEGQPINRVVVPEGWPNVRNAWQPPEGCTTIPDTEQSVVPVLSAEQNADLEKVAIRELLTFMATHPDAPKSVKDFAESLSKNRE
jgi:hypothetical protein